MRAIVSVASQLVRWHTLVLREGCLPRQVRGVQGAYYKDGKLVIAPKPAAK